MQSTRLRQGDGATGWAWQPHRGCDLERCQVAGPIRARWLARLAAHTASPPPPPASRPAWRARRRAILAARSAGQAAAGRGAGPGRWRSCRPGSWPERSGRRYGPTRSRPGAKIALGTGGAAYLLLAYRRQRLDEVDTRERRITELYIKAVEQLRHEKAPVRLGALYSLERLAQSNLEHRQTVIDVYCAYRRMPYSLSARNESDAKRVKQAAPH
jgi:hypothetical protein